MRIKLIKNIFISILCSIVFMFGLTTYSIASEYGFGHDIFATGNASHIRRQLRLAEDVGFDWMRTVATWGQIEQKKGKYNWRLLDKIIKEAGPNKKILLTLYSSNGNYCKYQNIKKSLPKPYNDPNRTPSSIPENMEDYKRFLRAIVLRYKSKIKYWQIENEVYSVRFIRKIESKQFPIGEYWLGPIDEYLELLKNSYATIKEVDPQAKVLLSGIYFEPWVPGQPMPQHNKQHKFFKETLARVDKTLKYAKDSFDILDFHHYFSPESIKPRIGLLKKKMIQYGYEKEIWITESGGISLNLHPNFKNSLHTLDEQKQQAEEVVKFYVTAFAQGVKKIFWFELSPPPQVLKQKKMLKTWTFGRMYLAEDGEGNKKKLAYETFKLMVKKLNNFTQITKLDSPHEFYKFEFDSKKPVYVLWSDQQKNIDVSSFIPAMKIRVINSIKEKSRKDFAATVMTHNAVQVSKVPLFIEAVNNN